MTNYIMANFGIGSHSTRTGNAYQYDYGQILKITGLDLPNVYEAHFSNQELGESKTSIGTVDDGVVIPDEYLLSGEDIHVWIFLHTGQEDGETEYKINIPVKKRAKPIDSEPTPVQQDVITQTIAALNDAVRQTGEDVASALGYANDAEQSAQDSATSANNASQSETNALTYAQRAETAELNADASATYANQSATNAALSASDANTAKRQAEDAADRAEQSAGQSGYMFFYIDEHGHLRYQRTSNVDVDFYLSNGHLYVRGVS